MLSPDQVKNKLRALLIEAPDQVFAAAKTHIPAGSKKMKTLMLLEGRQQDLLRKVQSGVIAADDQTLESNRIREQLLLWIDNLEEKDLEAKTVTSKRRASYSLVILPAILLMLAFIWFVWFRQPFGAIQQQPDTNPDTVSTSAPLPPSAPEASRENNTDSPAEKTFTEPTEEIAKDQAGSPSTVNVKLNVLPLWKDSDILVDGKPVEPLERIGTYISLAVSTGSHQIRLKSGADQCEKNILVREAGAVIPFVCE